MHVGLGKPSARGVDGQSAARLQGPALGEGGALAASAKAVALEGQRDQGGEGVVELRHADVRRLDVGVAIELLGADPRRAAQRVLAPVVDHGVRLAGQSLTEGVQNGRRLGAVPGALGGDQHAGQRAVGLQAVVEEAERLRDPARSHVVLAGERAIEHDGPRIRVRHLAHRDGHVGEMVTGGAELVHVAPGEHGDLVHRPQQAPGARPGRGSGELLHGVGPGPGPGTPLARAPGHAHPALPGGDGHGEKTHRGRARSPAVAHLAEEGDVAGAEVLGDLDLVGDLHGVGGEAVHLGGLDAGVVESGQDGLDRQLLLGAVELLGKRRLADSDDGGGVLQHGGCRFLAERPLRS